MPPPWEISSTSLLALFQACGSSSRTASLSKTVLVAGSAVVMGPPPHSWQTSSFTVEELRASSVEEARASFGMGFKAPGSPIFSPLGLAVSWLEAGPSLVGLGSGRGDKLHEIGPHIPQSRGTSEQQVGGTRAVVCSSPGWKGAGGRLDGPQRQAGN